MTLSGKRVKSEGGLRVDWRQTTLQANSPATNTAVAHLSAPVSNSNRDDSTDEPEVEGKFNQDEEKAAFAGNCIALSETDVWMSAAAAAALAREHRADLAAWGFAVKAVPLAEIEKAGGSLRCCVAEIY